MGRPEGPGRSPCGPLAARLLVGHHPAMSRLLSPVQVAKLAQCGRSSVMRALSSGDLRGIRDNKNRWQVDEEEAKRWAGQRPEHDRSKTGQEPDIDRPEPVNMTEHAAKLAAAETEARMLRDQVADLRADRDRLTGLLEKALAVQAQPVGFFARLFRR